MSRAVSALFSGLVRWWNGLWFEPSGPHNLGFCRMLLFALVFWFYWKFDFSVWGHLPASFQNANPVPLFELLGVGAPTVKGMTVGQLIFRVSTLLACLGLFTRTSCAVALLSGIYVLGIPHTFGKTAHGDGVLVLAMLVLALSRCGDAWSIDAVVRSWRRGGVPPPAPLSAEYTWPVRCMWLLTALVFLAAGIAKLRMSGFAAWALSDNMSNMLLQHHFKSSPPTDWGLWVAKFPLLCVMLAAGTIIIEVAFPLALFSRVARWVLVPSMFLAQVMIGLLMGVFFTQFMFIYLFWVPWDRVGLWLQRRAAPFLQSRAALYDGGCGFCRRAVAVLSHMDVLRRVEFLDVTNVWPQTQTRFPELERQACLDDMHVIRADEKVFRGFDGYRSMAWVLPAAWTFLPLLYLPPVRWLGWTVYRHVATHRHDARCDPMIPTPAKRPHTAGTGARTG